jgi:hypothetical protein
MACKGPRWRTGSADARRRQHRPTPPEGHVMTCGSPNKYLAHAAELAAEARNARNTNTCHAHHSRAWLTTSPASSLVSVTESQLQQGRTNNGRYFRLREGSTTFIELLSAHRLLFLVFSIQGGNQIRIIPCRTDGCTPNRSVLRYGFWIAVLILVLGFVYATSQAFRRYQGEWLM